MPQVDGIKKGLMSDSVVILDIEYMDAKRFPDAENLQSFRDRLALKMQRQSMPDVLLVGDDIAFKFAQTERDKLFAGIPIIFLGVNNIAQALKMDEDIQFTGVVEKASLGATLNLAVTLAQDDGRIYVISDPSKTGRINFDHFLQTEEYKKHQSRIEVLSLVDMSYQDLSEKLRELKAGSVINLLSAFQDANGVTKSERGITGLLIENTSVPFVHPWEAHLGHGSMGGVVVSHYEQGRQAGKLATAVLSGRSPADIPVVGSSPNKLVIDYEVMNAFGYEIDQMPAGAEFINFPETLLGEYKEYAFIGGVFLVLQSGIIFLLVILNRRRRIAEKSHHESQKRFRDFANSSSDWFWEMDDQLRFSYFSGRFEEMTGVHPSKLLGKTREETGIPGVEKDVWEKHLATLRNHEPFREFVHPRDKNGEIVWVAISGEPAFDPDGHFLGYRGTGSDITERRAADEALRAALKTTEQANQSKSNFLAMMSHEFRTPLNAILGFSDIMRQQIFGPLGKKEYTEYASDIHDSGKHMLALVNDILDISAVEAGKREFEREEIVVSQLLEEGARSMRQYAIDRNITVDVDPCSTAPKLNSDRRAVMQILYNLLSNAIKYTAPCGRVVLSSSIENERLTIQVSDTGVGIPEDQLPDITEAFTRSHSDPLIAQEEGTGLGLAIVQSLTHELGATLFFESTVGKGTTVIVAFPMEA